MVLWVGVSAAVAGNGNGDRGARRMCTRIYGESSRTNRMSFNRGSPRRSLLTSLVFLFFATQLRNSRFGIEFMHLATITSVVSCSSGR